MKAIIMAGGEGSRLRPLTSDCPKPMISLLDKPVLEYILALLRENDVTEACLTLKYLPDVVTAYFGDGSGFGIKLDSRIESEPLGTAGSVRACTDFIGDDDVLIMSGDCVCDFDLVACVDFHKKSGADATIVLYSHPDPTEYGSVVTDESGRIERFCEKPSWEGVITGDISTGIYILSPSAVRMIPEGTAFDFGRDLFPQMLREGRSLFAVRAEGYWCDVGSPEAYLQCCMDALSGAVRLPGSPPDSGSGIRSLSLIPGNVIAAPPVYIGENVSISRGAHVGPNAVIGSGSTVEEGAIVKNSVIDGAVIKSGAVSDGAVVGKNSTIGEGASLDTGSVIGGRCSIGKNAVISAGVKLWPGRAVPDGARITENITGGMYRGDLTFSHGGVMHGNFCTELTPEACISIGAAADGPFAIASDGSPASSAISDALCCGALSAGTRVFRLDAAYPAAAAFAGRLYAAGSGVFVSHSGESIRLSFSGSSGAPVERATERKLEAALRGETRRVPAAAVATADHISGVCEAFAAHAADMCAAGGSLAVSAPGRGAEVRTLKSALNLAGISIAAPRRGVPAFDVSGGGFGLAATDEEGFSIDRERMLLITALAAFETGIKEIAAPFSAPAALDRLAERFGHRVLRLERDGEEAKRLYMEQPFLRFGVFAALLICGAMRSRSIGLSSLRRDIPAFATAAREIPVIRRGRGSMMAAVSAAYSEFATEFIDGFSAVIGDTGRIRVTPARDREALIIRAEGETEELAEELCADFERRSKQLGL